MINTIKCLFLHQENTCIQVCPDYGKNLLFVLVQKWPLVRFPVVYLIDDVFN